MRQPVRPSAAMSAMSFEFGAYFSQWLCHLWPALCWLFGLLTGPSQHGVPLNPYYAALFAEGTTWVYQVDEWGEHKRSFRETCRVADVHSEVIETVPSLISKVVCKTSDHGRPIMSADWRADSGGLYIPRWWSTCVPGLMMLDRWPKPRSSAFIEGAPRMYVTSGDPEDDFVHYAELAAPVQATLPDGHEVSAWRRTCEPLDLEGAPTAGQFEIPFYAHRMRATFAEGVGLVAAYQYYGDQLFGSYGWSVKLLKVRRR